jgi:hypothetical protein
MQEKNMNRNILKLMVQWGRQVVAVASSCIRTFERPVAADFSVYGALSRVSVRVLIFAQDGCCGSVSRCHLSVASGE